MKIPTLAEHFYEDFYIKSGITVNLTLTHREKLANFALGLVDEAIELHGAYFDGYKYMTPMNAKPQEFLPAQLEIGDVTWYVANLQRELGLQPMGEYTRTYLEKHNNALDPSSNQDGFRDRLNYVLNNAKDAGESVKKFLFHGNKTEQDIREPVEIALRNVLFGLSDLCNMSGFAYETALTATSRKLFERYPGRLESFISDKHPSQLDLFGVI